MILIILARINKIYTIKSLYILFKQFFKIYYQVLFYGYSRTFNYNQVIKKL